MNENILERFGRSKNAFRQEKQQANVWILPQQLNPKVRQYYEDAQKPVDGGAWLQRPEIPTSSEVLDLDTGGSTSSGEVELAPNRTKGPYDSKEEYLSAHYELLREDAVRPLRVAVTQVRITSTANEDAFNGSIGIYEKAHICGFTCSTRGIATKVTFSLGRVGKKILWEQSKRLITGSLVVLTPAQDMFKTKAIVAVIVARPLAALTQNPPEIDLFIRPEEQEIDPKMEFVMIEDRGGLYEADRHTLLALQRMMREPFPLHEHLVGVQANVTAPKYVEDWPTTDLSSVLTNNKHENYENINILKGWPSQPHSDLDSSQLAALRRILTKRLAVVQGPPGTGKTYISKEAIRIMLANHKKVDPPIIIACQTNHAVDQILKQIAEFEPEFVRLGGRSKDKGIIKARTLFEVRNQTSENPLPGCLTGQSRKKMKEMEKEFGMMLLPLKPDKIPLDHRMLEKLSIITKQQADSLESGASQWVQDELSNPNEARSPFKVWIKKDDLVTVPPKQLPENFGFEYEEADLEFEALKELEAENVAKDDEDYETLSGSYYPIADNFTGRKAAGVNTTETKVPEAMKQQDMWKVPQAVRPAVYRYLQAEVKKKILSSFRTKTKTYNEFATKRRIGFWEQDETILKEQKVIGMTTTGFSKYRGLIAALEPRVVLIEEAAETLEAPVTVTCLPSLQHLILVGDHKQLRPHCHVKQHENKPFYLNVSLFERLVKNNVEYDTLSKQRRMIPEIRRILYPIYKDLIKDHASVLDPVKHPNVPGMGGVNSWFFTHQWKEERDEQMSSFNPAEADMIVAFVEYLVHNGTPPENITLLTFYNGQRKKLLKQIRDTPYLAPHHFKVVTVDSYQGEENEIVILSLVRSNDKHQMGFLNIDNRVCVALSRAKCGFYIFGNGELLFENPTWEKVILIMANRGRKRDRIQSPPEMRLDDKLPIRCSNHDNVTEIRSVEDWGETHSGANDGINGGCREKCGGTLACGHFCKISCHPFPHEVVICREACAKTLTCGHACRYVCGEHEDSLCACEACKKTNGKAKKAINAPAEEFDGKETLSQVSDSGSWTSFSKDEPGRYAAAAVTAYSSQSTSPEKPSQTASLVEIGLAEEVKKLSVGLDTNASLSGTMTSGKSAPVEERPNGKREKWTDILEDLDKLTMVGGDVNGAGLREDWSKEDSLLD